MAVAELIVSRREVLAAGCAACLTRHPELDSGSIFPTSLPSNRWTPDQARGDGAGGNDEGEGRNDERGDDQSPTVTKWDRALARFRRAEAVLAAAAHEPDEDRYDALNGAFHNALRRLLRTPAPDLPALAAKIHLSVDHEIATLTGGENCQAALKADTNRLIRIETNPFSAGG